ncbi:MAG: hypothetical protein UY96_C0015G0002 [Parcubacteria group bacterium GW2011_GWB1_56_8]|nr:MAG: hypothetical protein UY96_C0015G0002 [Parcubacteria group bacterium GW2011_GWB1_56_8]
MARAKQIAPRGIDSGEPSIRAVLGEMQKPLKGDPSKKASESGVSIMEYATRVLKNQGSELLPMFKAAKVEAALRGQGYSDDDSRRAVKELGLLT